MGALTVALIGCCCLIFLRSGREGCGGVWSEWRALLRYAAAVVFFLLGVLVLMFFAALMGLGPCSQGAVNKGASIW